MKIKNKEQRDRYQINKPLLMSIVLMTAIVVFVQLLMVQPVRSEPRKE